MTDSFQAPRAISSTARRHEISRLLLMTWRRSFGPEPISPQSEQSGFARVILAAEVEPAVAVTPTRWPKNYLPGCRMSREGMHKIIVNVHLDDPHASVTGCNILNDRTSVSVPGGRHYPKKRRLRFKNGLR